MVAGLVEGLVEGLLEGLVGVVDVAILKIPTNINITLKIEIFGILILLVTSRLTLYKLLFL